MRFGLHYPLWRHARRPEWLADALGQVGFDYIRTPVQGGACYELAFVGPGELTAFSTEGGWHVPFEIAASVRHAARPRIAEWATRDWLTPLVETAKERGLSVEVEFDAGAPTAFRRLEHAMVRNAWDQPVPGLCALNADLAELVRQILIQLQTHGVKAATIHGPHLDDASRLADQRAVGWRPDVRRWAAICLCASCRQCATLAGIDPDAVARSIRVHTERCAGASPQDASEPHDELLDQYLAVRRRQVAEWRDLLPDRPRRIWRNATDSSQRSEGEPLRMRAGPPEHASADELVRTVQVAARTSVPAIEFVDVDLTPLETLDWVRQAVRYARREGVIA